MRLKTVNFKDNKIFFAIVFALSILARLVIFFVNLYFENIYIDEAMTILNARSLADNMTDIMGERLPVYFDTWLYGGQSPFATYFLAVIFKIFGYSLIISRLPMLIFSIGGLVFFYKFLKEIFPSNLKAIKIIFTIAALSPWQILSSSYTLDCSFMPHILIAGFYLLAKGVNRQEIKYFVFSMVFFGVSFYCYILSAIIIPTFLLTLFVILLVTKKINIKICVASFITLLIIGLPFILFGLVQLKVIDEFNLFGFNYSYMPYYTRDNSINTENVFENIPKALTMLFFPDFYLFGDSFPNRIFYTNSFGGILFLLGVISLILSYIRKEKRNITIDVAFVITAIVSAFIICAFSFFLSAPYRFYSYNYIFYIVMMYGIVYTLKLLKKVKLRTFMSVFLSLSLITTFAGAYILYRPENIDNDSAYVNSLDKCIETAEENEFEQIAISSVNFKYNYKLNCYEMIINERRIISLAFINYDNIDDFHSIQDSLLSTGPLTLGNISNDFILTDSNKYYVKDLPTDFIVTEDCLVVDSDLIKWLKYDKTVYTVENYGVYSIMYKK